MKAADELKLALISTELLNEYIDNAPDGAELLPREKWEKRVRLSLLSVPVLTSAFSKRLTPRPLSLALLMQHLTYNTSMSGGNVKGSVRTIASENWKHESEGKTLMHKNTDPYYIERPTVFDCGWGRHPNSPIGGDCYAIGNGLNQWRYPSEAVATDRRVAYASEKYPWIISAHRMASINHHPMEVDVSRFKIDGEPGEHIVHWYWRGYSDCTDVAVLPRDVAAGTVVPDTSESMYGALGDKVIYARIDHCLFVGGNMQRLVWDGVSNRDDAIPPGQCSDNPLQFDRNGKLTSKQRTCFIIPPAGARNALNETQEEALEQCKARCDDYRTASGRFRKSYCEGLNVVPLLPPPAVKFPKAGTCNFDADYRTCVGATTDMRPIPYGLANCNAKCWANEPNPAESMVCYPLTLDKNLKRFVEEDWTLAVNDPQDEVWYSTCFKKESQVREFRGFTPCTEYPSVKKPMCGAVQHQVTWRHNAACISCASVENNVKSLIPFWKPIAPEECSMCERASLTEKYNVAQDKVDEANAGAAAMEEETKKRSAEQTTLAVLAIFGVNGVLILVVAFAAVAVGAILYRARKEFHATPAHMRPHPSVAVGSHVAPPLPTRPDVSVAVDVALVEEGEKTSRLSVPVFVDSPLGSRCSGGGLTHRLSGGV